MKHHFRSRMIISILILSLVCYKNGQCDTVLPEQPNIILLVADDLGWGDLYSTGHPTQEKNDLDRMINEGMLLSNFYSTSSMCSPSRASMLTGRIPARSGLWHFESTYGVFMPWHTSGLPLSEITVAEVLRDAGYATGFVGKWHLGINNQTRDDGAYLPDKQGFDELLLNFPEGNAYKCDESFIGMPDGPAPQLCFMYEGTEIIEQPFRHDNVTQRLTENAIGFIRSHKHEPFFLYLGYLHVHTALFSNPLFKDSKRGSYGNNVNEMAYSVGRILNYLNQHGLGRNTLVWFVSDNGPPVEMCLEAGSPGLYTGGKGLYYEGGIRVLSIAWWPGYISAGVKSTELLSVVDFLPTFAELAGASVPNVTMDGHSAVDVLVNNAETPHDYLFVYEGKELVFIRSGPFKLVFKEVQLQDPIWFSATCPSGFPTTYTAYPMDFNYPDIPILYNVDSDPRELYPLNNDAYADIVTEMLAKGAEHLEELFANSPAPLFDLINCDVNPCCEYPNCTCNYPGTSFSYADCYSVTSESASTWF